MTDSVELLRATLAALKEAGVLRAQIRMPEDLSVNVEFPVDLSGLEAVVAAGAPPVPGGWKGPSDLDAPFQDDAK